MKKGIFIFAMAAALAACNNKANKEESDGIVRSGLITEIADSSFDLYGKEWKLTELNGKTVVLDTTFPQYPHLIFQEKERLSGNLGCNGFGGNIKFEDGNTVKISDITATQMACPNLEVEQGFLDVLNNAKSYKLENNILTLSNDKKEVTAKLEGVTK